MILFIGNFLRGTGSNPTYLELVALDLKEYLKWFNGKIIEYDLTELEKVIDNRIKSEIAGTIWGKDEAANIRLQMDNQIIETLKHFNEADAFLESLN